VRFAGLKTGIFIFVFGFLSCLTEKLTEKLIHVLDMTNKNISWPHT